MEGRGPFGSRSTRGPHFDPWCSHSIRPSPPVPGKPLESSWRPLRCSLQAAAGCPDGAGLLWSCGHQRQGLGCPLAGLGAAAEPLPLTAVHV
jgi:hypothetical protein